MGDALFALFSSQDLAMRAVLSLCAVSVIVRTSELLAASAVFNSNGCLSWSLVRDFHPFDEPRWLATVLSTDAFRGILILRLAASVTLVVAPAGTPLVISAALASLTSVTVTFRMPVGQDGSDQMNVLILVPASLALIIGDRSATAAALLFIAGQALLAYTTSGVAKLMSGTWRSGQAIPQILSTLSYGNLGAATMFRSNTGLSRMACWSIMLFEASFAVVLVLSADGVAWMLAAGLVFHFACAVLMGLNCFFWSFAATYPALVFVKTMLE